MPERIQRKRTKRWRMPPNTVYVGRPSKYGNPWSPANHSVVTMQGGTVVASRPGTIQECVDAYIEDVREGSFGYKPADIRMELRGKNLACWCPLDQPCHADELLRIANGAQSTGVHCNDIS